MNNNIANKFNYQIPFQFFKFIGTHSEMGFQQGKTFSKNLSHTIFLLKNHEEINNLRPKLVPKSLFLKVASNKAMKQLKPIFEKYLPYQTERIVGIAEGSNIPINYIYLMLSSEILLGRPDYIIPNLKGCTDIVYSKSKSLNGHILVSRNFDFERFVVDLLCLRFNKPNNRYKSWDLSASPLTGTFNGMNEKGLFIATNEAFPIKEVEIGLPASAIIQEALETCENANDVYNLIKDLPRGSGNIFCVADREENIFAIEYTSKRIYKREMNKNYIVITNHYLIDDLKPIDVPRNAILGKKAHKALRGIAYNEPSYTRMEIAQKILESKTKFNIEDIKSLIRDHSNSENNKGGLYSICHHDPINITAAAMIFDLNSLEAWICKGSPCENEFVYFDLKSF